MRLTGPKPDWLTFDCYGTLSQWDEGLLAAVETILAHQDGSHIDPHTLIEIYDRYEHQLEQSAPHRLFRDVAGNALKLAMNELGLPSSTGDIDILTSGISRMPPFPEVPETLGRLKAMGFRLCIISNTDDAIIAGNVARMGGHVDRVITAEQAGAYKPSSVIFNHAHRALGVGLDNIVHVCASPHLDLAAARELGFRAICINRGTGRRPLADYTPDAECAALDQVPGLLAEAGWA
jgi:2-haloalkanoic acid dehalogenase type II